MCLSCLAELILTIKCKVSNKQCNSISDSESDASNLLAHVTKHSDESCRLLAQYAYLILYWLEVSDPSWENAFKTFCIDSPFILTLINKDEGLLVMPLFFQLTWEFDVLLDQKVGRRIQECYWPGF